MTELNANAHFAVHRRWLSCYRVASAEFNGKEIKMCTFFKNDKEIYLEMFGNDPIFTRQKMAEITLDKIKE